MKEVSSCLRQLLPLLAKMREMITFEQQYNMPSQEFYRRFMRGEMGDARSFIQWAMRYELYLNIKEEVESHMNAITGGSEHVESFSE